MWSGMFWTVLDTILCSIHGWSKPSCSIYAYLKTLEMVFSINILNYYICMLAASIVSYVYSSNFLSALHLMQVVVCSSRLQDILMSLVNNSDMISGVLFLFPIFIFIFASWTFSFISEAVYLQEIGENGCLSIRQCFITFVYYVVSLYQGCSGSRRHRGRAEGSQLLRQGDLLPAIRL